VLVSFSDLYFGFFLHQPQYIDGDTVMFLILAVGTIFKIILYFYCTSIRINSDILTALAEDHLNDVLSNSTAILTASLALYYPHYWYIDQLGAILISGIIISRWVDVITDQVKKIVGYTATPEFIQEVTDLAHAHDSRIIVDVTRAYHFGKSYIVEIEIILPELMTVRESHDIALELQHKIELNEMVERAFVHVCILSFPPYCLPLDNLTSLISRLTMKNVMGSSIK
jgi:divalent metal cation (Fe/Co/Zn/Cd) transporter